MNISGIESLLHLPTKLHKLEFREEFLSPYNVWIKRDDDMHPLISGNKWRKLKYQLIEADSDISLVASFGGPYSNHLVALAAVCQVMNLKSLGIIRSHNPNINTHSMEIMRNCGMDLILVGPEVYGQLKGNRAKLIELFPQDKKYLIIEEGGAGSFASRGVEEIIGEIDQQSNIDFDYLFTAVGTGTTLAGLTHAFRGRMIYGIAPFKAKMTHLNALSLISETSCNFKMMNCILGLRFGKKNSNIDRFIGEFHSHHNILLDPVYTARAMMNMIHLMEQGEISSGSNLLFYHSGGLQGGLSV
jgi:1-aminocyclopropane-1-carboxylate deaminase